MDSSFFFPLFLWSFLFSATIYSIYVGFGPPSERLRDPFKEHDDLIFITNFSFSYGSFEKTSKNKTKK